MDGGTTEKGQWVHGVQEKIKEIEYKEQQILKSLSESIDIGASVLTSLDLQNEIIRNSEKQLDEIDYSAAQSKRVLRGMTWWGWFWNLFTRKPKKEKFIKSGDNVEETIADLKNYGIKRQIVNRNSIDNKNQDKDIVDEMSQMADDLGHISRIIGEELDRSIHIIDRIADRADQSRENLKIVTKQADGLC